MQDWISNLMNYPGIAFLMFLENVFPPLPSELIMPLAGFQVGSGKLNFWGALLAGTIGSLLGQLPLYYIGKKLGEKRLREWADKHGEWLALSGDDIKKADDWFDNHGNKAVIAGRLIPGIRSLISVPAGIAEMNLAKFLAYSAIGTVIWTGALLYLGTKLGERYEQVGKYIGPASYVILGGIALFFVFNVIKRKRAGHGKKAAA